MVRDVISFAGRFPSTGPFNWNGIARLSWSEIKKQCNLCPKRTRRHIIIQYGDSILLQYYVYHLPPPTPNPSASGTTFLVIQNVRTRGETHTMCTHVLYCVQVLLHSAINIVNRNSILTNYFAASTRPAAGRQRCAVIILLTHRFQIFVHVKTYFFFLLRKRSVILFYWRRNATFGRLKYTHQASLRSSAQRIY